MNKEYDYIIAGGGLAGLSLLYYILEEPALSKKKILVIEFTTTEEGKIDKVVHKGQESLADSILNAVFITSQ